MNISAGPAFSVSGSPPEKCKYCRDDHQTCHDGDSGIENLYILGGAFNGHILLHVGAEGDQDTHGNGQRVEHLAHGGNNCHPGKVLP